MASGTISGTTSTSGVTSRIKWTSTIDIATNTSTVTAELSYKSSSVHYDGTFEGYLWIHGASVECQKSIHLTPGQWVAVGTFTQTVSHGADGSAAIEIYATGGISGTTFYSTTCSASVTLDTIPRTTTPTTSGTFNVGSSVTINLPRASDTFTHTVQFSLNASDWTTIATGVATSTVWTLPSSLATATPNAASGTVYIRAITYASGTNIGSETISRTFYITSAYAAPSATIAVSQKNSANIAQYIRGKSIVTLTATASDLKYGATAVKYVFSYGGTSQTVTSSATSASVSFTLPSNAAASYAYSVTLTDSRGYTASADDTITTVAYSAPAITSLTATRGNYDGSTFTANTSGNSLKIVAAGTITSLDNANAKRYKIDYRSQNTTEYTSLVASTAASSYAFSLTYYTDAIFSEYSAYVIKLTLFDYFGSANVMVNVSSKQVMLNFNSAGTAVGIGTIAGDPETIKLGWPLVLSEPFKVGGTNLLLNTEQARNITRGTQNVWLTYEYSPCLKEIDERTFTFSCEAYGSAAGMRIDFYFRSSSGAISPQTAINLTTEYVKYSQTFELSDGYTVNDIAYCYLRVRGGTGTVYIRRAKLERGTMPTDWSPAPEDHAAASHAHTLTKICLWSGSATNGTAIALSESIWHYPFVYVTINWKETAITGLIYGASAQRGFIATMVDDSGNLVTYTANLELNKEDGTAVTVTKCVQITHSSDGSHSAAVDATVNYVYGVYIV